MQQPSMVARLNSKGICITIYKPSSFTSINNLLQVFALSPWQSTIKPKALEDKATIQIVLYQPSEFLNWCREYQIFGKAIKPPHLLQSSLKAMNIFLCLWLTVKSSSFPANLLFCVCWKCSNHDVYKSNFFLTSEKIPEETTPL